MFKNKIFTLGVFFTVIFLSHSVYAASGVEDLLVDFSDYLSSRLIPAASMSGIGIGGIMAGLGSPKGIEVVKYSVIGGVIGTAGAQTLSALFLMAHPVYRNLKSRDTLFGLDLYDLVIMSALANLLFRFNPSNEWHGKILNLVILAIAYLLLSAVKQSLPDGFIQNRINFLFRKRRYLPSGDEEI